MMLYDGIITDGPKPNYQWRQHFYILPRRCAMTNNIMWLRHGWKGTRRIYGPAGEAPLVIRRYLDLPTYIILALKGTLNEETLLN
mgnify:CR=1 FL=1